MAEFKLKDLENLILFHYKDDQQGFFRETLHILKLLREQGCNELADYIEFELSFHYTVAPKKPEKPNSNWNDEITFEDADEHHLIHYDEDGKPHVMVGGKDELL